MTEELLYTIVQGIEAASGKLLQVVNFNVQQYQYVVAGDSVNLETLSLGLAAFKTLKSTESEDVDKIIMYSLEQARARKEECEQRGRPFMLTRGLATIPLPGIDMPFHSRELLSGVPSFRELLRTVHIVKKYIANQPVFGKAKEKYQEAKAIIKSKGK
ncbi:hypothetical protein F441_02224 [Phytophthora nicotianae CJ01A1]|nr:hypothetical protein F441_02224 [Phytophthora nicotianae CJ01A1]